MEERKGAAAAGPAAAGGHRGLAAPVRCRCAVGRAVCEVAAEPQRSGSDYTHAATDDAVVVGEVGGDVGAVVGGGGGVVAVGL